MAAADNGHSEVVSTLLHAGADVDAKKNLVVVQAHDLIL